MISVASVCAARNEEEYLPLMISSLRKQTLPPKVIIIVNDGSTDETGNIAKEAGCIVLDLPYHKENHVGTPKLAKTFNIGLNYIKKMRPFPDYVLIIGADHLLPPKYIEETVARMQKNEKLVVASGSIENEVYYYHRNQPRGSGRVIDLKFWMKTNDLQFPINWGWESWLFFKAMERGYDTRCFRELISKVHRPTGWYIDHGAQRASMMGKTMYALGYDWRYVLGRCLLTFSKSPKEGLEIFWSWLKHSDVEKLDVAKWVNNWQKQKFPERIRQFMKRT